MTTTDRIRTFVADEILYGESQAQLTDDAPLLDGIIDSLALMQIVAFLEEEFAVEIDDAEITADNFRTFVAIARLVEAKASTSVGS